MLTVALCEPSPFLFGGWEDFMRKEWEKEPKWIGVPLLKVQSWEHPWANTSCLHCLVHASLVQEYCLECTSALSTGANAGNSIGPAVQCIQ